jgi:chorismate dehydratase
MPKLRVTTVSYLNTKPFIYGIFRANLHELVDLQLDIPSICATKLKNGAADLGLVPVAIIPEIQTPYIISDYCIGTENIVKTVCIFSKVPLDQVENLYLDYHSRTSVELTKILLREYWQLSPRFIAATEGFESKISGKDAALIIGDRAMGLESIYPYIYDLGEAWKNHTGLPFVFAAWVSNRKLDDGFIEKLNEALRLGIDLIPQLPYLIPSPHKDFDLKKYFTEHLSYTLDAPKREALELFLSKMTIGRDAINRF